MKGITGSLGFRLTATMYALGFLFLTVVGFTVYRLSQDSIKMGAMGMVRGMAEHIELLSSESGTEDLGEALVTMKFKKTGSAWIMDSNGTMIYSVDPLFRRTYLDQEGKFGNINVALQFAAPRQSGQGVFKEKLIDIVSKSQYDEGFGTYSQFGEKRILAFHSLPGRGLLIGVDEPVTSANSELERIKKYVFYTALVSALLIMIFSFFAIRIIIRPYYQETEDLNASLQQSNDQLEEMNAKLGLSNKNLTALHEIGLAMQQSLTLKDILDMIITGAHDVLDIDRINLMLPGPDGRFLECRAAIGHGDADVASVRVPMGGEGGALAASFERKEVIRFDEGAKIPPSLRLAEPYSADPLLRSRAFVVIPLVVKDHAVGVIGLDNKASGRPISEGQVNLLTIFANQAAVAVENARLYEELRKKIEELDMKVDQLSILHQIGNSMQRVTDRSEALGFILRGVREGLGFEEVALFLLDREEETLRGELGLGCDDEAVKGLNVSLLDEENLVVMSAAGKRPVGLVHFELESLVKLAGTNLREGTYRESFNLATPVDGSRMAAIAVPLIAREEVVGVVAAAREHPPTIRRSDIEMLMLYASTAGLTVERAELYSKMHRDLESMEITDHVSRLFTNRYGQQRVQEEISKSGETGKPLAVMLAGIDSFKEYNDRCGHELGDRSMAQISDIIKTGIRGSDFAYRYGGRLLVAVMPSTDSATAVEIAEGIQSRIRRQRFEGPSEESDETISLSIAVIEKKPGDGVDTEADIFKLLLGVLHRAEAEGGDRILTG